MNEDIFRFATIDKIRNKLISIKLEDASGKEINTKETIEEIKDYIDQQLSSKENNSCIQQVYPLIVNIFNNSIVSSVGDLSISAEIISEPRIRMAIIQEMMITHYLMKYIQKNNIKIISIEKDVNQEDIKKAILLDRINSYGILSTIRGLSFKEILTNILNSGLISKSELLESGMCKESDLEDIKEPTSNDN